MIDVEIQNPELYPKRYIARVVKNVKVELTFSLWLVMTSQQQVLDLLINIMRYYKLCNA